jgi:starch phosphorylase
VWKANVGRVPLYLLDTNLAENSPADREITSKLYGGGTEMRIKQEIVLGIGGMRALEALNVKPTTFHMNEGHSAFLALERIRVLLEASPNLTFDEARQQVMATNCFTTHTPVPAGIDMFPPDLVLKYFRNYYPSLKLDEEGFLALGREDVTNKKQGFSMAVLAIPLGGQRQRRERAAR